jgi:hypothetical protein
MRTKLPLVDKSDTVRVYTEDEYAGECNMLVLELVLILKASVRFLGHRLLMAHELGLSKRHLLRLITAHGLEDVLATRHSNTEAVEKLKGWRELYPVVFDAIEKPSLVGYKIPRLKA